MALDYVWEEKTLAGWLSDFRAKIGYVACDVIRCLGEAAAPGGGVIVGRAPTLYLIPWHLPFN